MTVDYPDPDDVPAELRAAIEDRRSLNVFRMVAHSPNLAPEFLRFGDGVLGDNTVPATCWSWRSSASATATARTTSTTATSGSPPGSHRPGPRRAARTGELDDVDDDSAAVIRGTDALLDHHRPDDAEVAEALRSIGFDQLADVVLTVDSYQLVCGVPEHVPCHDGGRIDPALTGRYAGRTISNRSVAWLYMFPT